VIPESHWIGGLAEWIEGDTAFLSVAFTWKLDEAFRRALFFRAIGYKVRAGGPALFQAKMRHELVELQGVQVGGDYKDAIAHHNPAATVFSRGCPEGCGFCIVTPMEGAEFTLIPDAPVRPVLCDNNLSALPAQYQDFIIERYRAESVPLLDANSGFEPKTFSPDVYARWKPLVNNELGLRDEQGVKYQAGPWRFAYDDLPERKEALAVMRMLADEPAKRKRVYVLIGNEPFADCMQRIQETLDHGCEPHIQPVMKLVALEREPWVQHDWTAEKLRAVARWGNRRVWRYASFADYDPKVRTGRGGDEPTYDHQQGLFL
jgi:hypothetical protein